MCRIVLGMLFGILFVDRQNLRFSPKSFFVPSGILLMVQRL
jgi:hypothetical protein